MQVAVVGLGKMGSALARRLLDQDVAVKVWNRSSKPMDEHVEQRAVRVQELSSVWQGSEAVVTFLADDRAVRDVCLGKGGLIDSAPIGGLLLEMSTISPDASRELAREASHRQVRYLRVPVSGNPDVLSGGRAALIVSGDSTDFEHARTLLELIGRQIFYVGDLEQARVAKLAINAMLAAIAEMLAEVVTFSEALGLDRAVVLEVLAQSVVGSPFVEYKKQPLIDRDYNATFTTGMLLKDLELVRDAADRVDISLPVTRLVTELTAVTCREGFANVDFMALLPHLQRVAGVPSDLTAGPSVALGC